MDDLSSDIYILEKNRQRYIRHSISVLVSDGGCFPGIVSYCEVMRNHAKNGLAQVGNIYIHALRLKMDNNKQIRITDSEESIIALFDVINKMRSFYEENKELPFNLKVEILLDHGKVIDGLDKIHGGKGAYSEWLKGFLEGVQDLVNDDKIEIVSDTSGKLKNKNKE